MTSERRHWSSWSSIVAALALMGACGGDDTPAMDAGPGMDAAADAGGGDADGYDGPVTSRYVGDEPPRFGFCDADAADVVDLGSEQSVRVTVDTRGPVDAARPSTGCTVASGATVADAVFRYTPPFDGVLVASTAHEGTTPGLDTILSLRDGCDGTGTELACDDDAGGRRSTSRLTASVVADMPLFIVVDGFSRRDAGRVELSVAVAPEPMDSGRGASSCADATELVFAGDGATTMALGHGDTTGGTDEISCSSIPTTDRAPEEFFTFTIPDERDVTLDVVPDRAFDAVIEVFDDCAPTTEVFCSDLGSWGFPESGRIERLAAGTYVVAVDGYVTRTLVDFAEGTYEVRVTASRP